MGERRRRAHNGPRTQFEPGTLASIGARTGIDHRVVPSNSDNTFDMEAFESACADAGTKLRMVAMSHVGNLDGVAVPIEKITKVAHDHGALVAVDGAQSTPT